MTLIMGFLPRFEQLRLQGLNTWWYVIGVGRVQVHLEKSKMFHFVYGKGQVFAVSETGR